MIIVLENEINKASSRLSKYNLYMCYWDHYYSISDKEKKRIFADSIVKYYTQFHQYDSVAKYSGEIAVIQPTEMNLLSAGDAYMQASDLVSVNEKSAYIFFVI